MGDPVYEYLNVILPLQNSDSTKHGCVISVSSVASAKGENA